MKKFLLFFLAVFSLAGNAQFIENFNDDSVVMPPGPGTWTLPSGNWLILENGVGNLFWGIGYMFSVNGTSKAAAHSRQNIGAGNTSIDYLVTPLINLPPDAEFRFNAETNLAGYQNSYLELRMAPAASDPGQMASFTTLLGTWQDDELFDHASPFIIDLAAMAGSSGYFAFVRVCNQPTASQTGDFFQVDNVMMVSSCANPSAPTVTTSPNVTASWNELGTATEWEVQVVPTSSVFNPNIGVPILANTNSNFALTKITQPFNAPLSPNTQYVAYVRSKCSGAPSLWQASAPFTTPSDVSVCGTTFSDIGGTTTLNNVPPTQITFCPNVPGEAISATFSSMWMGDNQGWLSVYEGSGTSGQLLMSGAQSHSNVVPPPFISESPDGCLTFVFQGMIDGPIGWEAAIDCVPITCPKPTGLTVDVVNGTSATLDWAPSGSETQWEVFARPCSSNTMPLLTTPGVVANTHPFTLGNLAPNNCYDFFVRAVCGPGQRSGWSLSEEGITPYEVPVCGGYFYDPGGLSNFPNNSDVTTTICPENAGDAVTVTFQSFAMETNYDGLYVFDGNSIGAPQISSGNGAGNIPGGLPGPFWGFTPPGPFTSTSPDGCLTFRFRSDATANQAGWIAGVSCAPAEDYIRVVAFFDTNGDGIRQNNEPNCPYGQFTVEQNNDGSITYVDSSSGVYVFTDPNNSNTYDIGLVFSPQEAVYYSTSTSFTDVSSGSSTAVLYFPVTVLSSFEDVEVWLSNAGVVAGMTRMVTVSYKNHGNSVASGTITFTKDPVQVFDSASPAVNVTPTGFTYNFSNLAPNMTKHISVMLHTPPIPTVSIGDLVTNSVSLSATTGDIDPFNNADTFTTPILTSYDPNEIVESHGPQILVDNFGQDDYLRYTIHFQNTGNFPASHVRLEQALDAQVDEESFEMIGSSDAYVLERTGNSLVWKLPDILLPPQSASEEGSKGFVTYKVKMKPGFEAGDIVPSSVSIYFDANPAVVTDTYNTFFVDQLSVGEPAISSVQVYPNPAKSKVNIDLTGTDSIRSAMVFNVLGGKVAQAENVQAQHMVLDISGLQKGIYVIKILSESGQNVTRKLMIE